MYYDSLSIKFTTKPKLKPPPGRRASLARLSFPAYLTAPAVAVIAINPVNDIKTIN
jgi:hypothetical protein